MPLLELQGIASSFPKKPVEFANYVNYVNPVQPPLRINDLAVRIVVGAERRKLKILTDGDISLFLLYQGREAAVCSARDETDTLILTQREFIPS